MPGSEKENRGFKGYSREDDGTEDELSGAPKLSRSTPRSSIAGRTSPVEPWTTPDAKLRHLAATIRKQPTSRRRASSVGVPRSQKHVAVVTPNIPSTSGIYRPLQLPLAVRSNPSTPHALRAFQQRRATPGQDRRKSGRMQRKTPRDALRNLSKVLAPTSQLTDSFPQPLQSDSNILGVSEHELDLLQPDFSIAIDDEAGDNDSFLAAPPRLSMQLEDGEHTGRSVEIARRAVSEKPPGRHSRGSFGSIRASDPFRNISELGLIEVPQYVIDESIFAPASNAGTDANADADELGGFGSGSDLWSAFFYEMPVQKKLTAFSGGTQDLQRAILEATTRRKSRTSEVGQAQHLESATYSPFILDVPRLDTMHSSSRSGVPEKQHGNGDVEWPEFPTSSSRINKPSVTTKSGKARRRIPRAVKRSRHGIPYSSLPPGVTKKIASNLTRSLGGKQSRVNKETLDAIIEAGDQYLEQLGGDLGVFANHAGRTKIDESDIVAVMKRQRRLSATVTPFSLAREILPAELLREIQISTPKSSRQDNRRRLVVIEEDHESED